MNFIKHIKTWFLISGILIVISIVSLSLWGLKIGIDFKGGTLIELSFKNKDVNASDVKNELNSLDFAKDAIIQKTSQNSVLIRTVPLDSNQVQKLESALSQKIGESQEIRLETVGPTVGKNITTKAIWAMVLASIAIIIYITWAFRSVPKPANPWRFGVSAVLALIHDIFITIGIFAALGHFLGYEVDSLFITALLTVMGFSVHDTIVVFDRMRENLRKYPSKTFDDNTNDSVIQTLARSLNTSMTLILVLVTLLLIGGESIKHFIATLLVGVAIGTYSSIFTALPLLVVWQRQASKNRYSTLR